MVGEREGDGREGGWEDEMGVDVARNPVTGTNLDSTSRMF